MSKYVFFCIIVVIIQNISAMKLKNSFLIGAGVFFLAVAFKNGL